MARKRPSIQEPTGEVDEWEAMRSPSKSIPRTPIGISDGKQACVLFSMHMV